MRWKDRRGLLTSTWGMCIIYTQAYAKKYKSNRFCCSCHILVPHLGTFLDELMKYGFLVFETGSHYAVHTGLKFMILLPRPPKCHNSTRIPQQWVRFLSFDTCVAQTALRFVGSKVSCLLSSWGHVCSPSNKETTVNYLIGNDDHEIKT